MPINLVSLTGICAEPGSLPHATRSGDYWPYSTESTITYVCNTCYTGGGKVTCQSNGTWTDKPMCKGELPQQLEMVTSIQHH